MDSPAAAARQHVDALSAKDFATVTTLYADELVWHQPGANRFSGKRDGATLDQADVDVLAVQDGRIAEVWLFSSAQEDEDTFWGTEMSA